MSYQLKEYLKLSHLTLQRLATLIFIIIFFGSNSALGAAITGSAKATCLTATVSDPSYMASVEQVTALPFVKKWAASIDSQSRMAVGGHVDKTEFIEGQCYWSISLYEDNPSQFRLWKVFRVGISKKTISIMDNKGIYRPVTYPSSLIK